MTTEKDWEDAILVWNGLVARTGPAQEAFEPRSGVPRPGRASPRAGAVAKASIRFGDRADAATQEPIGGPVKARRI
jgi:hypothetical protein